MAMTYSTARTRPFTGSEYLESLRDGREIWIYGERVQDVTTHPAFRNTARMIARMYDAIGSELAGATSSTRGTTSAATRASDSKR
jgi:4-hydroxyphenylacetate 3-monooxygenase